MELLKIFTSFLTIISGVVIFVAGQVLLKFTVEPIYELNRIRGEIANALIHYANVYMNSPPPSTDLREDTKKRDEVKEIFRSQASQLCSKVYFIPWLGAWELLNIVPKFKNILEASEELIRLSNSVHRVNVDFNRVSREKIGDLLNITPKLKIGDQESMNNKIKKIVAREGLVIIGLFMAGIMTEVLRVLFYNLQSSSKVAGGPLAKYHLVAEFVSGQMVKSGCMFIAIIYPIYLVLKFIIWAFKTLKQKHTLPLPENQKNEKRI